MTSSSLSTAIRHSRQASGLTLEELAARSRVSRSTLAKIEAGDTVDPGFSVVSRLLAAAGASDDDFVALCRATVRAASPRALGVGYEGLDQGALIELLRRQHVEVVADVRLTPISRKAGLSKTALRDALTTAKIEYVHLPALGNPKQNRAGYGDPANLSPRRAFQGLLKGKQSQAELAQLRGLAATNVVAVLCFESDERMCHREQVLAAISAPNSGTAG